MRRLALCCLLPALAAAPAAAQGFEGTVTLKMPIGGNSISDVKYLIKGERSVVLMTLGADAGPVAGKEMRMIADNSAGTMTVLIPMEMMGMKGVKSVVDMKKELANASKGEVTVKELGTSEMIAGYKCNNLQVTAGKDVSVICLTKELGSFTFPGGNPMGRGRNAGAPSWTSVFATHPGFPLKVSDGTGKVLVEVTAVNKGKISADEFVIPEGYSDLSSMMGGRRGGGGGF